MNPRFPILSFFSLVLRIFGWVVLICGIFSTGKQAISYFEYYFQSLPNGFLNIQWLIQLILNSTWLLGGCIIIIVGEIIGVVFSIENNIHKLVELRHEVKSNT